MIRDMIGNIKQTICSAEITIFTYLDFILYTTENTFYDDLRAI